jgi:calcium-dependent protein kinase
LLNKNPKRRPSAQKALGHEWFKNIVAEEFSMKKLNPIILKNIRNFEQPKKFVKTILNFIVKELNHKEIQQLKDAFNILDKKKTGRIDIDGLKEAFEYCNISIEADEIKSIFININPKKEQTINYTSFIAAAIDRKTLLTRELLAETFKMFVTDHEGSITVENFEKAIERTGKKKTKQEILAMFEELGLSKDESITFDKFVQILNN